MLVQILKQRASCEEIGVLKSPSFTICTRTSYFTNLNSGTDTIDMAGSDDGEQQPALRALRGPALEGPRRQTGCEPIRCGLYAIARGSYLIDRGSYTRACGSYTTFRGSYEIARGSYTIARGSYMIDRGSYTRACGSYTIAQNLPLRALRGPALTGPRRQTGCEPIL